MYRLAKKKYKIIRAKKDSNDNSEPTNSAPAKKPTLEELRAKLAAAQKKESTSRASVEGHQNPQDPQNPQPAEENNPASPASPLDETTPATAALHERTAKKAFPLKKKIANKNFQATSESITPAKTSLSTENLLARLKEKRAEQEKADADAAARFAVKKKDISLHKIKINKKMLAPEIGEHLPAQVQEQQSHTESEHQKNKDEITKDDLNANQLHALETAINGRPLIISGGAGSGKTTLQRIVTQEYAATGRLSRLTTINGHKRLTVNSYAAAIISFTNKAVENIRDAVVPEFKPLCMTGHKLLQYQPEPVIKTVINEDGIEEEKEVKMFMPFYNKDNKLPHMDLIIIEEGSNFAMEYFEKVWDALPDPRNTQFIIIGDLFQIKPVFGKSVMVKKIISYESVGLSQVYRQSTDSPIKKLAMDINAGYPMNDQKVLSYHKPGEFEPVVFKKRVEPEDAIEIIGTQLGKLVESGDFIPGRDIVLTPFNTGGHVNVQNINLYIADKIRKLEQKEIFEVFARMKKFYLAVGDIVTCNKRTWVIKDIVKNDQYFGLAPREATTNLNRWGNVIDTQKYAGEDTDFDSLLAQQFAGRHTKDSEEEEQKNQASHIITLEPFNKSADEDDVFTSRELKICTAGDFDDFDYGYATTIHKAQGSEWHQVIMVLHHSQMSMACREILYTGVTRARRCLKLWFDGENRKKLALNTSWMQKGIVNQQIPGTTIDEKITFIKKEEKADTFAVALKIKNLEKKAMRISKINKDDIDNQPFLRDNLHSKMKELIVDILKTSRGEVETLLEIDEFPIDSIDAAQISMWADGLGEYNLPEYAEKLRVMATSN